VKWRHTAGSGSREALGTRASHSRRSSSGSLEMGELVEERGDGGATSLQLPWWWMWTEVVTTSST
jgi:hypothetical protein